MTEQTNKEVELPQENRATPNELKRQFLPLTVWDSLIRIFLLGSEECMFRTLECLMAAQGHSRSFILAPVENVRNFLLRNITSNADPILPPIQIRPKFGDANPRSPTYVGDPRSENPKLSNRVTETYCGHDASLLRTSRQTDRLLAVAIPRCALRSRPKMQF